MSCRSLHVLRCDATDCFALVEEMAVDRAELRRRAGRAGWVATSPAGLRIMPGVDWDGDAVDLCPKHGQGLQTGGTEG